MRFRAVFILMIAMLAVSPRCSAADDKKLSSEFQAPARDYLKFLHECSDRALKDDNATCDEGDVDTRAKSAASSPGDKAVLTSLTHWDAYLAAYRLWVAFHPDDEPEERAKFRSKVKYIEDVCSGELEKTLQTGVAPEKSECDAALQ